MSHPRITALGYVGIESPDPGAWLPFATGIVGLMPARALPGEAFARAGAPDSGPASAGSGRAADGSVYLKGDERQWRIAIHPGERSALAYLGLELMDEPALDEALAELVRRGVPFEVADPARASARGVRRLAMLRDPAGNALELFCLPVADRRFTSPCGAAFRMGALGVGHVNLLVSDLEACIAFYTDVLGFRLSDFIEFGPGRSAWFLRCNARHHSLALTRVGEAQGLQHLMLELTDSDGVGLALDRVMKAALPISSTLGRHKNDRMLSFYVRSPDGFDLELGAEGLQVGEDWVAHAFCEGDVWGHHGLTAEAIAAAAGIGGAG